jgi:hypothetical protein
MILETNNILILYYKIRMDNICAPNKYDTNNNTCFSLDQLIELTKAYNRYVSKNQLDPKPKKNLPKLKLINMAPDKKYLLDELRNRFQNVCDHNELCWTQQEFMNEIVSQEYHDDLINSFRPIGPDKPNEWLSTSDIDQIMEQYEKVYPDFKFLGAVPSDCDKWEFCSLHKSKLDFDQLARNKIKRIGIVFNHDTHGQPGSHWVALYINLPKGQIYYCDSTGKNPIGRIKNFIENFKSYYEKKTGKEITYKANHSSYQTDNSECGIYSCNFIIRLLYGETFDHIISNPLRFEEINSCRNVYFSNKPVKKKQKKENKLCDPGNT